MEEKKEKVEYYKQKVKNYLDAKIEDAFKRDIEKEEDILLIQTSLRIYKLMDLDFEFLDLIIKSKIIPEFLSLKQLKRITLGPTKYYFESLLEYVERRMDVLIEMLGKDKNSSSSNRYIYSI